MAVVLELNIDGATVKFRDNAIRSRDESEKILQRVSDMMLRQLNAQHNAKRFKELEKLKEEAAE
jgi:hypothetical protein